MKNLPALGFASLMLCLGLASCATESTTVNLQTAEPESRYATSTYTGAGQAARAPAASPVNLQELELLKTTLLLGEADLEALRRSRAILEPQVEAILDVWYGFVGSNPHLLASFQNAEGEPQGDYLAAVRKRFGAWILDTASARFDADWLAYQEEIGLRHHRTKKNRTDGADAAAEVPFRYLVALVIPITTTLRPFLEKGGASAAEVDAMHQAWVKAVLLQAILWSRPYVRDGSF
jgi:hypothetical protein